MGKLRVPLAAAVIAVAALATACAPESPGPEPSSAPATSSPPPSASAEPTPGESEPPVEATCEGIVDPAALASLTDAGWTYKEDEVELVLGSVPVSGSIGCVWGDYSTANDNVVWLAWGILDEVSAQNAIAGMLAEGGWRQEDAPEGTYITEDGDNLFISDENGYGRTFLFADEQVKGATTKAELGIIVAPAGFTP